MEDIKKMYKKIVKDNFPNVIKMDFDGQVLIYKKKMWNIYDSDEGCNVKGFKIR